MPPGSGVFIVCCANTGAPLGIFQENRYLTDLRTGAAGAIAVKHCASKEHENVVFIGTGAIAQAMAENTHCVHKFKRGYAFGLDPLQAERFANITSMKLGYPIQVCNSAEEAVRNGDVVFTQTTASAQVLRLDWLRPHATIIASGSDQSTKNEIPPDVMAKAKMICDLKRQCARVGELRTALQAKVMTEEDVYAELGEVVNGTKPGRVGRELILVDLTGTGAQDAAIGQVAWDTLSRY